MGDAPTDDGPIADLEVDHGEAGTQVPPRVVWVVLGMLVIVVALVAVVVS